MKRRRLLRRTGALGVLALAGCVSDADRPAPGDRVTHSPTPSPTETETETPADPPTVVGSSVETTWTGCSQLDESRVMVDVDEESGVVTASGLLVASNPCHEVTLEAVAYDAGRDALSVVLGTESTAETCEECVGSLVFEARVEFEGGVPEAVFVHRADDVLATAGVERDPEREGTETPDSSELVETAFEVTGSGRADDSEETEVRRDTEAGTVTVAGTIVGTNGCTTAELGEVSYDAEARSLSVDVETVVERGDEPRGCTQALVWIDYEATFTFEGGLPESVTVTHDGEAV